MKDGQPKKRKLIRSGKKLEKRKKKSESTDTKLADRLPLGSALGAILTQNKQWSEDSNKLSKKRHDKHELDTKGRKIDNVNLVKGIFGQDLSLGH